MSKTSFVVGEHQYLAKMVASILNAKDHNFEKTFFASETVCLKRTDRGSCIGFVAGGEINDSVLAFTHAVRWKKALAAAMTCWSCPRKRGHRPSRVPIHVLGK